MQKKHKAKKSLGQNFLKSEPALKAIIVAGEIKPDDVILEIGPGKGALTKKLLEYSGTVIAVEKDRELISFLQEKFTEEIKNKKLILIEEDILEFNLEKFSKYKIIANIPYNITGAILKKFLTEKKQPERMVLMVQNEVAKRIVARDGKESILSISVKAYGEPSIVMKVPARYFSPAPKVDSAVILIKNISRERFHTTTSPLAPLLKGEGERTNKQKISEEKFWELVKAGFAHKRKKLSGNLKNFLNIKLPEKLKDARAEELTLSDWLTLAKDI
ncbi:MAG: 16S rRNA (adenine(1518)-N(6)/adenine(1519)-N(6))-dimethyltransferase RsmA [Patescibacteria group bacterium]